MLTTILAVLCGTALADDLRLNSSTAAQLTAVDGVDTALASRIVDLRTARGQLRSVESLRVLDIPAATLDNLRQDVIIDLAVEKQRRSYTSVDEVLAEFANEPNVRQIQAMSMAYTQTNPELVQGWLTASRRAYLLPKLNLQYEKQLDLSEDYEYLSDESGSPLADLTDSQLDNDDKYVVKLEWRLDKLVMSSEQIRGINESQDIVKLRDKVLDEITRLYFDRRRLQVELLLSPAGDLRS